MSRNSESKRCLIVKCGAIGDVVMAIPAVRRLYEQGYQVDWVCGTAVWPLLSCYSWLNPIIADDQAILQGRPGPRLNASVALWKSLIGRRYDLCATLYYDRRYGLLSLPVRAHRRISLSHTDREMRLLAGRHHADEYERILLGRPDSARQTSIAPVRPDRLPASPLEPVISPIRIAIVPGGASNMIRQQTLRRWPVDRYASLATVLTARGWEVVLLGGPDDAWVRPFFEGLAVTDCIGRLSLPQVISVCDSCDAVVSHDTGPLHLAGLSHAALIGLFGPTDPLYFLPRRDRSVAIWGGNGFACRPCYDGRDFAACTSNDCMREITLGVVLAALDRLIPWPAHAERTAAGDPLGGSNGMQSRPARG